MLSVSDRDVISFCVHIYIKNMLVLTSFSCNTICVKNMFVLTSFPSAGNEKSQPYDWLYLETLIKS